jgi:hypothetical protein
MFFLLDGFSRSNQVIMEEPDRLKTTFKTKWGTYSNKRMPFGLVNTNITFKRDMEITFKGLISQSVVVYLNDVIVYSSKMEDHPRHLKQIFER